MEKELSEAEKILKNETDRDLAKIASDEAEKLKIKKEKLSAEIEDELNPSDQRDSRDIIVEIRAGAGGEEAALFTADLFRMYARFAEGNKWQTILLDSSVSASGGFKEGVFEINFQLPRRKAAIHE